MFGKLIPVPDYNKSYPDAYFVSSDAALSIRKYDIAKVFNNRRKKDAYCEVLREAEISYGILDLLNELFATCCKLDVMTDSLQIELFTMVENAIIQNRDKLNDFQKKLETGHLNMLDIDNLLELSLKAFTEDFFIQLTKEAHSYIDSLHEMQEFATAEENLIAFCISEKLPEPIIQLNTSESVDVPVPEKKMQFDDRLLGKEKVVERADLIAGQRMTEIIKESTDSIIILNDSATFYFSGSAEIKNYFRSHKLSNNYLISNTLSVLDTFAKKADYDLIFTTYGIIPVKSGTTRAVVKYSQVKWICTKKQEYLEIDGKFELDGVDAHALYDLCMELRNFEQKVPEQDPLIKLPYGLNFFKKND